MKTFALFLAAAFGLVACAGPSGSLKDKAADTAASKTISLQIRDKTIWTWSITAEGVRGNGVSLQREGAIIFGYLGEEQVRFTLGATSLDAGKGKLSLQRDEDGVRLEGIAEEILVKASVDGTGIRLANPSMALELKQAADDEAQVTLVDASLVQ